MPNVQFDTCGGGLGVRRIGHRVSAPCAVAQDEFDVLACVVAERIGRRQLQAHLHHVVRLFLQRGHAHRHLLDGVGAFVGDLPGLQHHIRQRPCAAGQHETGGFFVGAQCLGLMVCVGD